MAVDSVMVALLLFSVCTSVGRTRAVAGGDLTTAAVVLIILEKSEAVAGTTVV